jgi:hypothetical protein
MIYVYIKVKLVFREVLLRFRNGSHTVHPVEVRENERKPHRKRLPRH